MRTRHSATIAGFSEPLTSTVVRSLDLQAAGDLVDRDDLDAAAPLGADRQRRREADLVEAVVDADLDVGDVQQLHPDRRRERQRQVAVRDRAAERRLLGALDVDVDEL